MRNPIFVIYFLSNNSQLHFTRVARQVLSSVTRPLIRVLLLVVGCAVFLNFEIIMIQSIVNSFIFYCQSSVSLQML